MATGLLRAGAWISSLLGRESLPIRVLRPVFESLLAVLFGRRGVLWAINGAMYRIDPRLRHRVGPVYDAPVAAFLSERVKPGDLCLDVGANVGVYVLQFARWSAPNGVVVAFEPNPHARKALERHLTLNGLGGRVRVEPAAVADAGGEAILHASGSDGMSRLGAPNVLLGNRTMAIPVPVVTLDEYCAERALVPQWLLLDVEGFELAALRGARRLIASRGAALGIVVEMHPDVWDPEDRRNAALLLAELGRRPVPLTGQRDALSEHGLVFLEPL